MVFGWIMAPFLGLPCNAYAAHHLMMHHTENNHAGDLSSTELYQRDSLLSLARYTLRFVNMGAVARLCLQQRRHSNLCGIVLWAVAVPVLLCKAPLATACVFVAPFVLGLPLMALGNFSQHMFVDPTRCESNYLLTYNCIDAPGNQRTFNDGYHVIHHLNPRMHWSELAAAFASSWEKHSEEGALTFRGIHFMDVGLLVLTGQLKKLVERHYVHLGQVETAPTVDEVVEKLREWLKPLPPERRVNLGAAIKAKLAATSPP